MFELAVPLEPVAIPPLHTYEEARQVMYNLSLHWQDLGAAQLGKMDSLSHLVTTTIVRRAGEGLARFVISTPDSPSNSSDPKFNHFEIWPGDELKLSFSSDPSAYTINGRCKTIQDLASIGTWYLLATQRFNESFTPHNAQAAYNAAIIKWNEGKSQQEVMQEGTEAALLGLIKGTSYYLGSNPQVSQETEGGQYLINKVTIDWGKGVESCLSTWR